MCHAYNVFVCLDDGLIVRKKKPVSPNHLAEYIEPHTLLGGESLAEKSPKNATGVIITPLSKRPWALLTLTSVGRSPENTTSMKMSHLLRMFINDEDTR